MPHLRASRDSQVACCAPRAGSTAYTGAIAGLDVTYQRFSLGLSALAAALAGGYAWRFPDLRGGLMAASYVAVAFYVLPTSTHERYMYPFIVLAAPLLLVDARMRYVYPILSGTLLVNMLLVAPPVEDWMLRWDDALITHYIAGLNVVVFGALTWMLASDIIWTEDAVKAERSRVVSAEAPQDASRVRRGARVPRRARGCPQEAPPRVVRRQYHLRF